MAYFYVKKVSQSNETPTTYTASALISNGDYFLLSQQTTETENGIYRRLQDSASKINPQPQPAGTSAVVQSIITTTSGTVFLATAVYAGQKNLPLFSQINITGIGSPSGHNGRWTVEVSKTGSITSSVSWYTSTSASAANTVSSALSAYPDLIISTLDNQEWYFTTTTRSVANTTLSAGSAIRAATYNYFQGATKPVPLGISSFPEQIDILKILDFSTETDGKEKLTAYYTAMANYYASPTTVNLTALDSAANDAKSYILTDEDYNKLAQSVMNTQLYLKQYLPQISAVSQAQVDSIISNADSYYIQNAQAYTIFEGTSQPSAVTIGGTNKNYMWFDTTQ